MVEIVVIAHPHVSNSSALSVPKISKAVAAQKKLIKDMIFLRNDRDCKVFVQNLLSRHNNKNDTTAQLYCTLSTYVTPKTISRQNQKN